MSSGSPSKYPLAPELWHLVFKSLRPGSLNCLCRTSHRFLELVRPTLYHTVDLEYRGHSEDTLKLLCNDHVLAKHVLHLTLSSPSVAILPGDAKREPIPTFYLGAIQNMTSLKRLTLRGSIFNDVKEQELFVERTSTRQIPLEGFDFTALYQLPRLPGDVLPLPNLTSLAWMVENTALLAPMWSALEASRETLQSLNLPFNVTLEETYLRLWKMRFPCLKSLSLGVWHFDVEGAPAQFTDFIIAHGGTLEELELGYGEYDEYAMDFGGSGKLKTDSLPRLKMFKGHTSAFKEMVQARMDFLRSLHVLEVGPGGVDDSVWELEELFDELERWRAEEQPGRLPVLGALKELRLDLSQWEESAVDNVLEALDRCANLCGRTLEVWRGDITNSFQSGEHTFGFGKFEKLRVIYLKEKAIARPSKIEDVALGIAFENPLLEELIVTDFRAVGRPDVVVQIIRREDKPVSVRLLPYSGE